MPKKTSVPSLKPEGYGVASKGDDHAPQIRHSRPEVARHCARMIISCNMDAEAAVSKMLAAQYPNVTDAQIVSLARTIQSSPHVQREMAAILEDIGYGDDALKKLIGKLWEEVLGQNDKRWAAAARLLAEITGASKASEKNKTIPTLKLAGMEEGLSAMLGDAAPTNDEVPELDDIPSDILEDESSSLEERQ